MGTDYWTLFIVSSLVPVLLMCFSAVYAAVWIVLEAFTLFCSQVSLTPLLCLDLCWAIAFVICIVRETLTLNSNGLSGTFLKIFRTRRTEQQHGVTRTRRRTNHKPRCDDRLRSDGPRCKLVMEPKGFLSELKVFGFVAMAPSVVCVGVQGIWWVIVMMPKGYSALVANTSMSWIILFSFGMMALLMDRCSKCDSHAQVDQVTEISLNHMTSPSRVDDRLMEIMLTLSFLTFFTQCGIYCMWWTASSALPSLLWYLISHVPWLTMCCFVGTMTYLRKRTKENCPSWIRDFQREYVKHGIQNTKAQAQYLLRLAEHYEQEYLKTTSWRDAFKAFSLYNAVEGDTPATADDTHSKKAWNVASQYLVGSRDDTGSLHTFRTAEKQDEFFSSVNALKLKLKEIRWSLKKQVEQLRSETEANLVEHLDEQRETVSNSNERMVHFAQDVIGCAVKLMGAVKPPCKFSAVGIGSLGRGEATPYSDLEFLFLIENSLDRPHFEKLAVLTYFLIGALKETKLSSIAVDELNGDSNRDIETGWFVDGRMHGYQIDGITITSDNIPTRAQSSWRTDSGGFIATPTQLLAEYKKVLDHPIEKEALRGDITSMLMFTKLLYTNEQHIAEATPTEQSQEYSSETLLSIFEKGREKYNREKSDSRIQINLRMLKEDLKKFEFHPEFDFYSPGFTLNVKTELYRFPSILLLDLTTIIDGTGNDSWSTLENMRQCYGNSFADRLLQILVYACFSRLRCYLAMDSHNDMFEVEGRACKTVGDASDFGNVLGYASSVTPWKMARIEFFAICKELIAMQLHMQQCELVGRESVEYLLKQTVMTTRLAETFAHYYCSEWQEVVNGLDPDYLSATDYRGRIAFAFSLLRLQHKPAYLDRSLTAFEGLKNDLARSKPKDKEPKDKDIEVLLMVLRHLAQCYKHKNPRVSKKVSLEAHELISSEEYKGSMRSKAFFLMEHGLTIMAAGDRAIDEALRCLFEALSILVRDAATSGKCGKALRVIDSVFQLKTEESHWAKLDLIGNPTREIAHCLVMIARIFEMKNKVNLARMYYEKAKDLGLEFLIQAHTDSLTKATILLDFGKAFKSKEFLNGAMRVLGQAMKNDSLAASLRPEIILSVVEYLGTIDDKQPVSDHYAQQLEQEINRIMAEDDCTPQQDAGESKPENLFSSNRSQQWFKQAVETLRKVHNQPEMHTQELADFIKDLGDILHQSPEDASELHKLAKNMKAALVEKEHQQTPMDIAEDNADNKGLEEMCDSRLPQPISQHNYTPQPSSMTLKTSYRIAQYEPEAVCYHQNFLYVGTTGDVFKIDIKHSVTPEPFIRFGLEQKGNGVTSVAACGNELYLLVGKSGTNFRVQVHQLATEDGRAGEGDLIREWETDVPYVQFNKLRILNNDVIIPDPSNKMLKIYQIGGTCIRQIPCDLLEPGCVALDVSGDDSVVVSVKGTDTVFRFNIKTGRLMWKFCDQIREPEGVACYKDSYVLVTNKNSDNRIWILDVCTGEYRDEIYTEKVEESARFDLCINGDFLIIPGWTDNSVRCCLLSKQ